jgi:hypothetical protein
MLLHASVTDKSRLGVPITERTFFSFWTLVRSQLGGVLLGVPLAQKRNEDASRFMYRTGIM